MPITLDGSNGITTPTYGGGDTAEYLVPVTQFKNRIYNAQMQIDQRNNGAAISVTTNGNGYPVDRFHYQADSDATVSLQRSTTAPTGFTNSLSATVTTADASVGASQYSIITQRIEGFNIADLGWGTANAQTVTLSFWVRASVTGTYGGVFNNDGSSRSYPFTYTINSANTWEYKTVTVAGDQSGTWNTTNSSGIQLRWALGMGSSSAGTAGSWSGSTFFGATGAVNLISTLNATWFITGVQLEVGSTATSFDYRPYGTELALCQRYYWETSKGLGGSVASSTTAVLVGGNPVTMRATPTTAGNAIEIFQLTVAGSKTQSSFSANITIGDPNGFALECGNFTGLTQYYPVGMNSGKITFNSEL